jgi:NADH-quinone oxidoreductase subunit L
MLNFLLPLIPALPLAGFLLLLVFGRRMSGRAAAWLATAMVGAAFVVALVAGAMLPSARESLFQSEYNKIELRSEEQIKRLETVLPRLQGASVTLWRWIDVAPAPAPEPGEQPTSFSVDVRLRLDSLSLLMVLIITGVGFLIHVFSTGYMAHDMDIRRYFTYLNLFVFSMLVLVLGANFLVLFVGWELVGLCSYLLIGFWYKDHTNASAGRKAFVVNRIGDFAFIIGLMLMWTTFGTLDFFGVFEQVARMSTVNSPVILAICTLLLVGATGKSAQIPLYVWLPDAMAGPTPVSALIHAATMVTAGVYMMCRANVLFDAAPAVLAVVAVIGCATALLGAIIALAQVDIKRVLAYSTVSQLGFMFLAVGTGTYWAAMFHLMTHAFFKALLFLGAGSVMHGMEHGFHEEHEHPEALDGVPAHQDMRQMGGMLKRMPVTGWTFVIGGMALAGLFPLAGFWSKDEILHAVLNERIATGEQLLWGTLFVVAAFTAFLTALYTGRQLLMVFAGTPRSAGAAHAVESPRAMTLPLMALALLTVMAGALGLPFVDGETPLGLFLAPVLAEVHEGEAFPFWVVPVFASMLTLGGLLLAWLFYAPNARLSPSRVAERLPWAYRFVWHKLYVDELYGLLFVRPFKALGGFFWQVVDDGLVDGAVNGVGRALGGVGQLGRRWQTGYARSYALSILLGGVILALYFVLNSR